MEIQRCTGCGRMVDQSSRFCRYCGSRLQAPVSQPIHALLGIDPIPFLDGMEQAVLLSSDGTRKTYRVRRFGAPMLLQVVDCGSGSDAVRVFNDGILMLQSLARSGLVAPVRYHLHPDSGKFLGFLLEEDPQATTLKDRFRDNGMTVKEALELVMSLCRALPPLATGRGFLNISPDTVILTGISSGRLSSACVTLTETEQTLYSFSPFAHPESALRGQYLPEAPVWSVAAVLYYLLTGGSYPEKSIGGIPGPAAAIRESTLARCLDQALRQNCFSSPAQLLTALEEAYRTLTPQQLSRLLFGLAQWGAPSFTTAPPEPEPNASRSMSPAACMAPSAPKHRPAAQKQKKTGLLGKLFSRKEPASQASAPAPAPSPRPAPPVSASMAPPPPPMPSFSCPPSPPAPAPSPRPAPPVSASMAPPPPPAPSFAPPPAPPMPSCAPSPAPAPYPTTGAPSPAYGSAPGYPPAPAPQAYTAASPYQVPQGYYPPAPAYAPPPRVDRVQFSAVAPKEAAVGDYAIFQLFMYEEEFRQVVDEALAMADSPAQEKRSGFHNVRENTRVKVILTCPDLPIDDNVNEQVWCGGYLQFDFALCVPEDFRKRQLMLTAAVYFDDIPATRLMLIVKASCTPQASVQVTRHDIFSAFVSYASQDRARVAGLIQGMRKARPEMDIFFDVTTLRSGEDWEQTLFREIQSRDILFLCWSQNARSSPWVEQEWHYALEHKGIQCIEPIPLEPPDLCPPPAELSRKHFNDSLLYISR